ncbi:hypothetical protein [Micromonospora maritima]|uniref:hypothetical protein n=1 Tax=Micromonospora maritima TaxID=986711 RepID=UPI00157DF4F3|nr:hypothetical protein [Micromonospora maritima]
MRLKEFAVAVGALIALAGCGGGDTPASAGASPSSSPSLAAPVAATSSAAPARDAATEAACKANEAAQADGMDGDPKVMARVAEQAQRSAEEGVVFQGKLLADSAEMARLAVGDSDEFAMQAHMIAGSISLSTACIEAGYIY